LHHSPPTYTLHFPHRENDRYVPLCLLFCWDGVLLTFLPGWTLNWDIPDLHLLSIWNYKYKSPCPAGGFFIPKLSSRALGKKWHPIRQRTFSCCKDLMIHMPRRER
jgi:hypothetical protein